ncbi:uncharacterized protein LOC117179558 isoform X2 [Belonocnema kinseyi]|uniref:uncharacterized protein LOC117179558 isoform X2 n=1 Tax=Belonocnema kinseyi TaxID=2817044 RepID=UPI00143DFCBD|nr:uncharacterized protein LOC117179558 isoform X2 [Belonocnema kinseyi]
MSVKFKIHFAKDVWDKSRVDGKQKLKVNALQTSFFDTRPKKVVPTKAMKHASILKTSISKNQGVSSVNTPTPNKNGVMLQLSPPRTAPKEKDTVTAIEDVEEEIIVLGAASEDLPLFDPESEEILFEADDEEIPLFDPHDYAMASETIEAEYLDSEFLTAREIPEENKGTEACEEILPLPEPQNTKQVTEDSQVEARLEACERIPDESKKSKTDLRKEMRSLKGRLKHLEEIRDESKVLSRLKTVFNDDQMILLVKGESTRVNWTDATMEKALKLRLTCGEAGYTELLRQNMPLPSSKCLQNAIKTSRFTETFSQQVVQYVQKEFGSAHQGGKVDIVSALKKKKPGKRSCFDGMFDQ